MATIAAARRIKGVWRSRPTIEGAGVHLRRAFGFGEAPQFDPFLMLDDFRSRDPEDYKPGFPWHPHRGMETITYVLDGEVQHADNLGNGGVIASGDIQWMTAGSGILHQEMPKGDRKGRVVGFQLWANLPARHKMMAPRYRGLRGAEIPAVRIAGGATVRVVAGELGGVRGPVGDILTDPEYLDVSLPAGRVFEHGVPSGHTVFAYVIEGEGYFEGEPERGAASKLYVPRAQPAQSLILYGPGETVRVAAGKRSVRFLLVSGRPLREPIAWYGPIVMNTEEELRTAVEELRSGTFIKRKGTGL